MSRQLGPVERLDGMSARELMAMGALPDPVGEVRRLELILEPASPEQALAYLVALYRQFGVSAPDNPEDRRRANEGYLLAMRGYPLWAIREAGEAFIRGQVPEVDPDFMPRPARVGRELSQRVDGWRTKLGLAKRQVRERDAFQDDASGPLRPETRATGEKRIAELRASSAAKRRALGAAPPEWVDPNPITLEMLEAAGVPDAKPRQDHLRKAPIPDQLKRLKQ